MAPHPEKLPLVVADGESLLRLFNRETDGFLRVLFSVRVGGGDPAAIIFTEVGAKRVGVVPVSFFEV